MWREQGTVTVPALDPALRVAPGPKPSKPQKRGRPNHRQLSPAEEQQWQEDRGRTHTGGHPARSKPSSSLALRCPIGSLQAGTGAPWT